MSLLALEQFGFTYEGSTQPALAGIDLTVEEGQWLLLCGPTGSGKSTLLRALKPLVAPAGRQSGTLYYDGVPMALLSAERQAQEIGLVLQKGEEQMVMEVVWQELAFPLENLAVPQAEMRARIAELASFFGLTPLLEERLLALSGGQKQIINLASVLMMRPRVLLLDEPLAQLDPVMVRDFVQFLQTLHDELGLTIIIAEHHLEPLLPLVQRVLVLEDGHLAVDGSAAEACRYFAQRANLTDYIPDLVRLYTRTAETGTAALPPIGTGRPSNGRRTPLAGQAPCAPHWRRCGAGGAGGLLPLRPQYGRCAERAGLHSAQGADHCYPGRQRLRQKHAAQGTLRRAAAAAGTHHAQWPSLASLEHRSAGSRDRLSRSRSGRLFSLHQRSGGDQTA